MTDTSIKNDLLVRKQFFAVKTRRCFFFVLQLRGLAQAFARPAFHSAALDVILRGSKSLLYSVPNILRYTAAIIKGWVPLTPSFCGCFLLNLCKKTVWVDFALKNQ